MKILFLSSLSFLFLQVANGMQPSTSADRVQSSSGNPFQSNVSAGSGFNSSGGGDMTSQLANSAALGVGRTNEGPVCYRAVKKIIAHALQKNLNCVRGVLSGGNAINAMQDLPRAGFRNDMSRCSTPGAILVYSGRYPGRPHKRRTGDTAGHIEVLGSDGAYHYYASGSDRIDRLAIPPGRRTLTGCFFADAESIQASAIGRCGQGIADSPQRQSRPKKRATGTRRDNRR
ncbi:MAG: hypothetical protein ACK5P7_05065 [Bdellovibrio sp.]